MATETMITIIDLCGREEPQTLPLSALDNDIRSDLYELMLEYESPWFIGEFEYREV